MDAGLRANPVTNAVMDLIGAKLPDVGLKTAFDFVGEESAWKRALPSNRAAAALAQLMDNPTLTPFEEGQLVTEFGIGVSETVGLAVAVARVATVGLAALAQCAQNPACRGICFVAGTPVTTGDGEAVAIERLQVGDRVRTFSRKATELEPGSWARVRLTVADATHPEHLYDVELLRPKSWLQEQAVVAPGDQLEVHLEELGVHGMGVVEQISDVEVSPGPGRLVLMTVSHLNNDVYEVSFAEGGQPLRGTGAHPLYSLDRDDWVRVRDLQVGERLQTAEGAVTVESLEKVRGVHRVYNLEVEGDHEYLVGEAGVRAHNGCVVDDVIAETNAGRRNLTSAHTLTPDEALEAGEGWVGPGYREIGGSGSGVFRSADNARQFRMDNDSLSGAHAPDVPHVHLEKIGPDGRRINTNNHIPLRDE